MVRRIYSDEENPNPQINKHPNPTSSRKRARLRRISNKLLMWRTVEDLAARKADLSCYSTSCRLITSSCAAGLPEFVSFCPYNFSTFNQGFLLPCYNSNCSRNKEESSLANKNVKARPPNSMATDGSPHSTFGPATIGVLGENKPFPFPVPYTFKQSNSKENSILVLPKWCLKRLARQGGLSQKTFIPGFHHSAKGNPTAWPYPCPRPLFDHCWRYLTTKANSLHALALRFRQMYACIRWMDLWPEDPDDPDNRVWTHHTDHDEVRTVVGHKEHPPEGYYEQYKILVEKYSLEDDPDWMDEENGIDDADDKEYRHSKRKTTARKRSRLAMDGKMQRAVPQRRSTQREERWIDGVDLKLYEIAEYWHSYLSRLSMRAAELPALARMTAIAETAPKRRPPQMSVIPTVIIPRQQQQQQYPATQLISRPAGGASFSSSAPRQMFIPMPQSMIDASQQQPAAQPPIQYVRHQAHLLPAQQQQRRFYYTIPHSQQQPPPFGSTTTVVVQHQQPQSHPYSVQQQQPPAMFMDQRQPQQTQQQPHVYYIVSQPNGVVGSGGTTTGAAPAAAHYNNNNFGQQPTNMASSDSMNGGGGGNMFYWR